MENTHFTALFLSETLSGITSLRLL